MIISHKYKFIFIKTRKTAGTTIEYNISKYLGKNDIITPSNQSVYLSQNYFYDTKISKLLKRIYLNKIGNKFREKFSEHDHAIKIKKIINNEFHKNSKANFINICDVCHSDIHKNDKELLYKKTSHGYELFEKENLELV